MLLPKRHDLNGVLCVAECGETNRDLIFDIRLIQIECAAIRAVKPQLRFTEFWTACREPRDRIAGERECHARVLGCRTAHAAVERFILHFAAQAIVAHRERGILDKILFDFERVECDKGVGRCAVFLIRHSYQNDMRARAKFFVRAFELMLHVRRVQVHHLAQFSVNVHFCDAAVRSLLREPRYRLACKAQFH